MLFEWDETKNQINIKQHQISFKEAIKAFLDPNRKIRLNEKHSEKEMRYFCLGKVDNRIMTVRFVVRNKKVRIIGAGYWREGRRTYEEL
ncbi:MAG: hypothetical protein ACD_79C00182G0015 [uncultured bacterium]|nr:MAG: hypothetical protein ACD_79C00182G0015 [uncultured bacterium]